MALQIEFKINELPSSRTLTYTIKNTSRKEILQGQVLADDNGLCVVPMSLDNLPIMPLSSWASMYVDDFDGSNFTTTGAAHDWIQVGTDGLGGGLSYSSFYGVVTFSNPVDAVGVWDFGDGSTSTSSNPVHQYSSAGEFAATFTVTSTQEVYTATVVTEVRVIGTDIRANYISFTNPEGLTGLWSFGDDTTSTDKNPTKHYLVTGDYVVSFYSEAEDAYYNKTLNIVVPSGFSVDKNIITCTSTTGNEGVWDFGDGSDTETATNTIHEYRQGGLYTLSFNGSPVITLNVDLFRPPLALISSSTDELSVTLSGSGSTSYHEPLTYKWVVDGIEGNNVDMSYTFDTAGDKSVLLVVKDESGAESYKKSTVTVSPHPVADVALASTSLYTASFTNNSYSPGDRTLTHYWNFGDHDTNVSGISGTSYVAQPSYTYTEVGNYLVTYRVTDDLGQSTTQTMYVDVTGAYTPSESLLTGSGLDTMDSDVYGAVSGIFYITEFKDGTLVGTPNGNGRINIDLSFLSLTVGGLYRVALTLKVPVGQTFGLYAFDGMTFPTSSQIISGEGTGEFEVYEFECTITNTTPKIKIYGSTTSVLTLDAAEVNSLD